MEEIAWLETILNNYESNKSVSRVVNVNIEKAVPEGRNFASIIRRVTLDVILCSGQKSKLTLIMKKNLKAKNDAKLLQHFSVFKYEIKIYLEILKKFGQLMDEYQDNRDKLWGNLIGYKPYSVIIFEDLKRENYLMMDRPKMMVDKYHALLTMNSLGRFHAMGHVLIKNGIIKKDDLNPFYVEVDYPVINNLYEGGLKQLVQVIKNHWSKEWEDVAERLSKQESVIVDKLRKLFKVREDCFLTVCHGDFSMANMLFKYSPYDENIPVGVKFVDFQTTYINTYAFDIMHFLYTSVLPEVRRTYFKEIIQEYQTSLKSTLSLFGKEENAPTLQQVNEEIKRVEYYAFTVHILFFPMAVAEDKTNMFVMDNLDIGCNGMDAYNPEIFKNEIFKKHIQLQLREWLNAGLY